MDQSQNGPNGPVQQQHHNINGSAHINFLDGPQSYTEDAYGIPETGNTADFDFPSWNTELFQQPTPAYTHPSPSPAQNFDHNARQQQSSTPTYGGIQQTLSPSPFSQPQTYDHRAMGQPSYDPRSASQALPSLSFQYQPQPYQQNPNYLSRDQMLSPSQFQRPVSNASLTLGTHQQLRPASTAIQDYATQARPNPYQSMDPRQMHRTGFQSPDMGQFSGFNEHPPQPINQYISPQMLTASGVRGGAGHAQQFQAHPSTQQLNGSVSPYMNSIYGGDPRMYQSNQAFQQSITPANTMQGVQSQPAAAGSMTGSFQGVIAPAKAAKTKVPKDPNAPKKPRGRPRKEGTLPRVKKDGEASSSEESESDDELQIEEPEPELTPAPLTLAPPTEPRARAVYDAVSAVWSPRNLPANPEKVKKGGQLYSDTIRKLRDAWKPENEALTAAENANNAPKVAMLKEKVEAFRDTLKKILDRTDLYGHPAHLRHVPLYPYTLSAFNSFLVDRVKRDDYEAPLVTSMMKVFTRFDTMTEEQLEQSKLIKLIQRTAKKSNAETKALAQKVLDNATAATKAAKIQGQFTTDTAPTKNANGTAPTPARPAAHSGPDQKNDAVAGVKRPREGEAHPLPATKKLPVKPIVQASKPLAVQQAERRKAELAKQNAVKNEKAAVNGASVQAAPRTKVIVAPQKPATSGVFAGLMSASKKPGTTLAEKAAAAKSKPPVAPASKKESSPQPSTAPAKPAFSFLDALQGMDKPKEVVKKKEEVRPNETEEERKKRLRKEERSKLRVSWADKLTDVRLFTYDPDEEIGHANSMMRDVDDVGGEGRMLKLHLNADDLDDDEGEELDSYESPSEVDFSDLDWEERKGHFVKTGGPEMPESQSSEVQRLLEDSSVMVVYALPSDQPSSPNEPPETEDDYEPDISTPFGDPPDMVREREKKWAASKPQENQAPLQNGGFDINAIIRQVQQNQAAQQNQVPMDLQRTLSMFGQGAQPQAPPPGDLSKLIAAVTQVKGAPQPPLPLPTFNQPAPTPQSDITAVLAALQAQQAQQQGLPVSSHNNPNPYAGLDNDYSRKHGRNDSSADDGDGKKSKKKKGIPGAGDVPYNYKTMVCSFWQKGQCIKGDDCTYRHSD